MIERNEILRMVIIGLDFTGETTVELRTIPDSTIAKVTHPTAKAAPLSRGDFPQGFFSFDIRTFQISLSIEIDH